MNQPWSKSIVVTRRPRPDHPSEHYRVCVPIEHIALVAEGQFNYKPADNAPVAVPKNSLALRGEATFINLTSGAEIVVQESLVEVYRKIAAAERGEPPFSAVER